jgi:anti-sigma regulatory factor (Ser/Thr protein kinase)
MPVWLRRFRRTLEAAGGARGFLRDVLSSRVSPGVLDDVVLLTSELAINGVRHVSEAEGDWLEVVVDQGEDVLRVSVRGPGKDFVSNVDHFRPGEVGGWGLHMVDVLSSRWGVATDAEGTSVWFEIDQHAVDWN